MFCERCKKEEATVHLTEIIKNVKSEIHLCEKCAREMGLNSKLSNFSLSVPDMLTFLDIEEIDSIIDTNVCPACGFSYVDFKRSGKLGCPDCYQHLRSALEPVIASFHGEKKHIGKTPLNYVETVRTGKPFLESNTKVKERTETVPELRSRLETAVRNERYEEAALLRDRIKEMEEANRD